jgi:diguanylate cyclase (GGDEF)-like protein/PAS domain S-box-containing protein
MFSEQNHNNERFLLDIVENASDLIQSVDGSGKFIYVNRAWKEKLGYTDLEIKELTIWDIISPQSMAHCQDIFKKIMSGDNTGPVEAVFLDKNRNPVQVEGNVNCRFDRNGRVISTRGIFRDITLRRQEDDSLRKSEERAKKQREAIAALVLDDQILHGTITSIFKRITELASKAIGVERTSIWLLDDEAAELQCLSLFEATGSKQSSGAILKAQDMPNYFQAILKESRIYTEDAQKDLRASELKDGYLEPLGITSMLDAGIIMGGQIKGVISFEHVGALRKWHADEEAFASTVAALVAQFLISAMRVKINNSLQFQLKFEKLTSGIASYLISLPSRQMDKGINYALEKTGQFFTADRSYVLLFSSDGLYYDTTHEWCAEGIEPQIERNQKFPVAKTPWWVEQIRNSDFVYIDDIRNLPPIAQEDKEDFLCEDIKSILAIPLKIEGEIIGAFGFETVDKKSDWSDDHAHLMQIIAQLIASAINRNIAEEKIHHLSFHDSLTNLYNRSYLEQEMQRLETPRQLPISLIMADLNGLKLINDTYGHAKGDGVLIKAALVLKDSCRQEDIVARWGGDEFVILLPQTSLEDALLMCRRIKMKSQNSYTEELPLSMALGAAVKTTETETLTDTLREAEDNMYKHKLTESRSTKNTLLQALLKTLAEKSFETEAHTRRMQQVAQMIGERLNLTDTELARLKLLITLHDIGKINIAEEILTKEGSLTEEEWEAIRRHPEIGFRIARATEEFAHVAEDIYAHHERWDGFGYPRGLKGDEIPLLARITAIADAYEVMSYGRPYKKKMIRNEIQAELARCSGHQFDPELIKVFLPLLEQL